MSSTSTSSEYEDFDLTYYSECNAIDSINNPVIGSNVGMRFGGFFDVDSGLVKTNNNQGMIYCSDSSQIFSMGSGKVSITIAFPSYIHGGIYEPIRFDNGEIDEYLLWGANLGQYDLTCPGLYAALTPKGIEFTIWSSWGRLTIRDNTSNVEANTNIVIEFIWDQDKIFGNTTMGIKVDGTYTALGDVPIIDNSLKEVPFYCLGTYAKLNNLSCTVSNLSIYGKGFSDKSTTSFSYSSESTDHSSDEFSTSSSSTSLSSVSQSFSSRSSFSSVSSKSSTSSQSSLSSEESI